MKLFQKQRHSGFSIKIFVYAGEDGQILKRRLRKDLIRIARKTNIEGLTEIHTLKNTFASYLIMKGIDLPTVQRLMGYSDIQTNMIYAHLSPNHLVDAVKKLWFYQDQMTK